MQTTPITVNELQLAPKLHQAVDQNQRGDFGLLLAMLSQDVGDWPQFHLQDGQPVDAQLRQRFELPATEPLVANLAEQTNVVDNSAAFSVEGASAFRLQQCLRPEALVIRGAHSLEMSEVMENIDIHTRAHAEGGVTNQLPELPDMADLLAQQRLWAAQLNAA